MSVRKYISLCESVFDVIAAHYLFLVQNFHSIQVFELFLYQIHLAERAFAQYSYRHKVLRVNLLIFFRRVDRNDLGLLVVLKVLRYLRALI